MIFFPQVNPGRIMLKINENASLFTTAISYDTLTNSVGRPLRMEWIMPWHFHLLMAGAAIVLVGVLLCCVGGCMSLGNNRMKRTGLLLPLIGSVVMGGGLLVINHVYTLVSALEKADKLDPAFPMGIWVFAAAAGLILLTALLSLLTLPKAVEERMEMDEKFRLFLMFLPVLLLTFVFCYLPIYGWRFAFFDYKIGDALSAENFVGFKWFTYLFENAATRSDLLRVMRNTLIMSGLGILTSWLPIAFAVLLAEVRSTKFQRIVQTLTTIPNFISWVLVYAIAFAIFSTDGFINGFLRNVCGIAGANTDYLASADGIWVKMLLWGTWKGLGWSAIVYIAGIAGIDQQLYEAAKVDGANRYQCIWNITIPGLVPTYCVMLLMSIAGILSNGMDQYLVFENALNKDVIEVLDLYVYNIGIKQGLIPISTVVGVFKSVIGVTLLFGANGISKAIRGESII
ncbi:MAG: sugar ABC transporter permease [Clostridiales bacterium]|nr:sugar ABC transporter permease [Clostridiales bacterium]